MSFYRINPNSNAPLIFQASSSAAATRRANQLFPQGCTVEALTIDDLLAVQASGVLLPVAARNLVAAYRARLSERNALRKQKTAKQVRAAQARERVREEARAAAALERQRLREEAAATKRREAAKAKREAKVAARANSEEGVQPAAPVVLPDDDLRPDVAPWD